MGPTTKRLAGTCLAVVTLLLSGTVTPEQAPATAAVHRVEVPTDGRAHASLMFTSTTRDRAAVEVETSETVASGTIIGHSADGASLVLTAEHAVSEAGMSVRIDGRRTFAVEGVACGPSWADTCVLKLEPTGRLHPAVTLREPKVGSRVHHLGQTSGYTEGWVLEMGLTRELSRADGTTHEKRELSWVSTPVYPGDSGAGVFDHTDALVGVVIGSLRTENDTIGYVFTGPAFTSLVQQLLDELDA